MTTTAADVVRRMGIANPKKGASGFLVPCVTHADNPKKPSLSVGDGRNGNIQLWCFGGCSRKDDGGESFKRLLEELIGRGYVDADTEAEESKHFVEGFDKRVGKFWAVFDAPGYQFVDLYPRYEWDNHEEVVAFKARYSPKEFKWFTPNPEERGKWKARKPNMGALTPYFYPQCVQEIQVAGCVLHWPEGEKDAKRQRETFNLKSFSFGGVSDGIGDRFLDEVAAAVKVGTVKGLIVWADNDKPGLDSGQRRALMCHVRGIPTKLAVAQGDGNKDFSNWADHGATKDSIKDYISNLPSWVPPSEQLKNAVAAGALPSMTYDLGSEAMAGEYFAHKYGEIFKYVSPSNQWYRYQAPIWGIDNRKTCRESVKALHRDLRHDQGFFDQKFRDAIDKLIAKVQTDAGVRNVLSMASTVQSLAIDQSDLDGPSTRNLLNMADGVYNMETRELAPHSPKFLITRHSKSSIRMERRPEKFIRFLQAIWPENPEVVTYMLYYLGYCCTGLTGLEKFQLWTGPAGAGKSTVQAVMRHVLGDYCGDISSQTLREVKALSPGALSDIAGSVPGRRLVFASELSGTHKLDFNMIKAITGGDPVKVKRMNENMFDLRADAKLIFTAQTRPPIPDDDGVARRLLEVKFENKFDGDGRIFKFGEVLIEEEGDQIAGLLLQMASDVYESKLALLEHTPAIIEKWSAEAMAEASLFNDWYFERTMRAPGMWTRSSDLFTDFEEYTRRMRQPLEMSITQFGRKLVHMGCKANPGTNKVRGYSDIILCEHTGQPT